MNTALEAKLKTLPRSPGVYFHKSKTGEIIYVGKAAVLRNRVRQYFQATRDKDVKTQALVAEIADTDWVEVESEIDALFLESEMVKRYMPRYNVLLRDDKSQLFVRIDMKSEWPTVGYTRNPAGDGAEYYGPFYNGHAVKKALRYLRRVFPYLIKPPTKVVSQLDHDLGLSPRFDDGSDAYKANLRKLISYIKGNRKKIAAELEKSMVAAARQHDFETAAALRNKLTSMKELQRRIMFGDREFMDISKDRALGDLAELLRLPATPRRIEGFDVSHMSGTNVVASMVVFTNGVSDRAEYRKFKARLQHNDDTATIHDTLLRRLSEKNRAAWGLPNLIIIDGGKGQLDAACRAAETYQLQIPIVSVAKREELLVVHRTRSHIDTSVLEDYTRRQRAGIHVEASGEYFLVNLHPQQRNASSHSKNLRASSETGAGSERQFSDVVKLIQRIRDESHRFAVSYHTVLKRQKQTASVLEELPGIGPASRRKLLRAFGSMKAVVAASTDELAQVVGAERAAIIKRHLQ